MEEKIKKVRITKGDYPPGSNIVWFHQRYYLDYSKNGYTLIVEWRGQIMTIPPEKFEKEPPKKGKEKYTEMFGSERGKKYHLYGFLFEPDQPVLL